MFGLHAMFKINLFKLHAKDILYIYKIAKLVPTYLIKKNQ